MEEEVETYSLVLTSVDEEGVAHSVTLENTIQANATHTTPVKVEGDTILLGGTVIEGGDGEESQLPSWFTRTFPFLVPFAEPLLPILPAGLAPAIPLVILGIPLLVIIGIGAAIRSRGRGRKAS